MENDEKLEQTNETENVETQTTEENVEGIELTDTSEGVKEDEETIETEEIEEVKKFTQDEVNDIIKRRLARQEREYQKELSKYKDTENVLKSTLGAKDIEEANTKLREYYTNEGVELPEVYKPGLSTREIEALALIDAEEIIADGYDAMVTEANKLASRGYENLSQREQKVFMTLGDKISAENDKRALRKMGAKDDLLSNDDFIKFRKQFTNGTPMETIYELYKGSRKTEEIDNPGSMKGTGTTKVKEFYTEEEINNLSEEDLKDPVVWANVRKSMTQSH